MKYPKISIVIPLYEVFDFLSETISSCLSQDYPGEIEIILIDDCSPTSPKFIIEAFTKKNDCIKFIQNEINQGVIKTLNNALSFLSGEFVIFLGQDDNLSPTHVRSMHQSITKHDAAMVWCNSIVIDNQGKFVRKSYNDLLQRIKTMFASFFISKSNFISSTGLMIDVSVLKKVGGYPEEFKNMGEWLLWIEIIFNYKISYNQTVKALYRRHDKNITKYIDKDFLPDEVNLYYSYCKDLIDFQKQKKSFLHRTLYFCFDIFWSLFRK